MQKTNKKRIRGEFIWILLLVLVVVTLFYAEYVVVSRDNINQQDSFLLFAIVNVFLIVAIALLFIIIRNAVKFVYEKRTNIVGTRLRSKLVGAFIFASLVPTMSLFAFSSVLVWNGVDKWFGYIVEKPLDDALSLVVSHQQQACRYSEKEAKLLSSSITSNSLFEEGYRETLRGMFIKRIISQDLASVALYIGETEVLCVLSPALKEGRCPPLNKSSLTRIQEGEGVLLTEREAAGIFARAAVPLFARADKIIGAVAVDTLIEQPLVAKMDSLALLQARQNEILNLKTPIKLTYIMLLLSGTLGVVLLSTWFGFNTAKKITEPISAMADATKSIAAGDMEQTITKTSDDEIGVLVDAFNQMIATIKKSTGELETATTSIEERRKYIETVLEYASTGVIALDRHGRITTINSAAQKILSTSAREVLDKHYLTVIPEAHHHFVGEILQELKETSQNFLTTHATFLTGEKTLEISATVTKIFDDMGKENGLVVVFDDMTRLQQAERAAAWREVAKKMAHEVKNPLTPIQLSAQRLQKRLREKMNDPDDARLLEECTNTIVEHVSVLKKLVNAFSEYAKLPATEVAPHDMNAIISEPVKLFREAHKNIIFAMERDLALPDNISVDAEKINRVVVNLLNNAVASLEGRDDGAIVIKMFGNALSNSLRVEVQDNGCGVPAQNKSSVFDPYFSTKATGTGLGLAIVRSIISDHGGSVGIKDNAGGGTIVFFEIPLPTA